jgi:hypothetical protein
MQRVLLLLLLAWLPLLQGWVPGERVNFEGELTLQERARQQEEFRKEALPCDIKTDAGCILHTVTTTSTTTVTEPTPEMGCDLALVCSAQTEIQGKLDNIIDDSLKFKQVLRFGGFASGAYLVLFVGYLLVLSLMAIVRFARGRQEEQERERAKEAERAAKKLYKKLPKSRIKAIEENESML